MPLAKGGKRMNAKNAKTTFSFNVFLASIAAEPLAIKYKHMASILKVSESTISKLRHGRIRKMPENIQPDLMAARFASGIADEFNPTRATADRFLEYAQLLLEKYLFSESLGSFVTLFINAEPADEEHLKKFYSSMIPELISRCYEEAYANSERDSNNWHELHKNEKTDVVFQRICNVINQDVLDDEKIEQLLNVIYTENLRRIYNKPYSDLSFIKMVNDYVTSQKGRPFYKTVKRREIISISDDAKIIQRNISVQEVIISPKPCQFRFTLSQTFHHYEQLSPEEIVSRAFKNLKCTVNNIPLVKYINLHEQNQYRSPEQFVVAMKQMDKVSGMMSTELLFSFNLYPKKPGESFSISYEYSSTAPFIPNISCNFSYTLRYPCKLLDHEFLLDAKTQKKWGMRVKMFTPITNSSSAGMEENVKCSGTSDSRHIVFYDWTMAGTGYFCNIYETKYADSQAKIHKK
jgi:hypothetical protein